MYIGRNIDSINNISTLDNLSFNGSDATFNLTQNSVAFVPVSADALQIQIDGVIQSGNYTVSGSTVTFDFTPSGSSVCNGIRHFGVGLLTTVSDGAITSAKLGADSVNGTKIADDSISDEHLDITAITGQTAITSLADTDKFLVSDASDSGNLKYVEKQYLPSGGMVLVGSVSSTGSSSGIFVNGCFSSTYINYLFTYNIDFSSDGAKARVRFTNSSNTEQTSTYKQSSIRDSGSSSASSLYNSTSYFVLNDDGQSNFNNIPLTGHMYITDPNSSSRYTAFRNFASTSDSGRNSGYEISGGHYSENTSIAGLSIYPSGGNFEAWNFKVYGIVEA